MDSFFGQTLTTGGISTAITQVFKTLELVSPRLAKIPFIGTFLVWLVDTITPEDPMAIQIFNAILNTVVVIVWSYVQDGYAEIDLSTILTSTASFLQSQGLYLLVLKDRKVKLGGRSK